MTTSRRIIIDECVPAVVKRRLPHRGISTVQEMGWSGVKNGELLRLVAASFDVFVTSDKNLKFQQNLDRHAHLAVVVLPTNQVPEVIALLPQIDQALTRISPNNLIEI